MCDKSLWIFIVTFAIEYWLGKTKKVEANSIIELAINLLKGKK